MSAAAPAEVPGMERPSPDQFRREDRRQRRVPDALLAFLVIVVIMCASIAWGLATLDCPTGKGRWGTCNPRDPALREETQEFIVRLMTR